MTADTLISMVLDEGVKHVIIPNYKERPKRQRDRGIPFPVDQKIFNRAEKFYPLRGLLRPEYGDPVTREENDQMYGVGRSRNHHLNAVQRHVLPSLGTMMLGIRPQYLTGITSYTKLNKEMQGRLLKISDQDREIWNEYNRHLTDLAHHIHKTVIKRMSKVRAHGGKTRGLKKHDDVWQRQAVANMRHDVLDHRGLGTDISNFGELITAFTNPDIEYNKEEGAGYSSLDKDDKHLANHSVEQLRARLDTFYRNKRGVVAARSARAVVPKESHERILQASKQISIPKGWKAMIARNQGFKK